MTMTRSRTFAAKLLWLFTGTVLVCWLISSLLLAGILHHYTEQVREDQLKWLRLYTRTFVSDIRVGNTLNLRTKLRMLVRSEGYLNVSVHTESESLTEVANRTSEPAHFSWVESRILGLFDPPRFYIPLQDSANVKWGEFQVVADPKVFYHGMASTISTYIFAHLGLLLIFLGLLIFVLRRQIKPLQMLTRSVSFYANSERSTPEDLEAVLKHDVPGASEELVVLKSALEKAVGKLLQAQNRLNDQRVEAELTKIALQVAHDIRSPLCVLKIMSQQIAKAVSTDQLSLVGGAIEEIQGIAEDLLSRYRRARTAPLGTSEAPQDDAGLHEALTENTTSAIAPELIARHVESVLNSTRMEMLGTKEFDLELHTEGESQWAFATIDTGRFKRAFSNVLRNALEAIPSGGKVGIEVNVTDREVLITTNDNGPGISEQVITAIQSGNSATTKRYGHGLGLQYAKEFCHSLGGVLRLGRGKLGGTSISLSIPRSLPPHGFAPCVSVHSEGQVVVLDDDPSMHAFWRERFRRLDGKFKGQLHCFSKPGELFRWMHSLGPSARESRFLVDLELNDPHFDGVKILEQLDLWTRGILVSGREEMLGPLMEKYSQHGLTTLPKSLLSWVPIQFLKV